MGLQQELLPFLFAKKENFLGSAYRREWKQPKLNKQFSQVKANTMKGKKSLTESPLKEWTTGVHYWQEEELGKKRKGLTANHHVFLHYMLYSFAVLLLNWQKFSENTFLIFERFQNNRNQIKIIEYINCWVILFKRIERFDVFFTRRLPPLTMSLTYMNICTTSELNV